MEGEEKADWDADADASTPAIVADLFAVSQVNRRHKHSSAGEICECRKQANIMAPAHE